MRAIIRRLTSEPMTRIVALGSSNTERGAHSEGRYNWLDWLDVGLRQHYGRVHHVVNSGVSGQTTRDLLARFDRDVALYEPHVVIVTVGGNDCDPVHSLGLDEFRANLTRLVERIVGLGECTPILQTYYAIDEQRMGDEAARAAGFPAYMQAIRDLAAACGAELIDHLTRWDRLKAADLESYRRLMRDPLHLKPLGNMLMGLDVLRCFGAALTDEIETICRRGLELQAELDRLEREDAS